MSLNSLVAGIAVIILSTMLAGCGSDPRIDGPAVYAYCPLNFHTVAYPNNPNPKKAYACVSDDVGYLQGGWDLNEKMVPR